MPPMDLGVKIGMIVLVLLMAVGIVFYHLWLDRSRSRPAPGAARRTPADDPLDRRADSTRS